MHYIYMLYVYLYRINTTLQVKYLIEGPASNKSINIMFICMIEDPASNQALSNLNTF